MSELSPAFDAQAAEVCGLYLDPPENTIVVSIDEKTGIQAKGMVREDTQAKPGKPGRRDNEYVRNGTQNLFAALAVHSGGVSAMPSKTRNLRAISRHLKRWLVPKCGTHGRKCPGSERSRTHRNPHYNADSADTGATGLEPAASGVTGRRSNQLSYAPGRSG